jgi:hypothetical protein
MKGTITRCLKEMVENKFGKDKWITICEKSNFPSTKIISLSSDFDDAVVMALIKSTCETLGVTLEQAGDAFGDYWVNDYAPKIYKSIYTKFKNAREFILGMDEVHKMITKTVPNSKPPQFTYNFTDDKTLVMKYNSPRGLIAVLMGCAKGLGRYYNEKLTVTKIDDSSIKIQFQTAG